MVARPLSLEGHDGHRWTSRHIANTIVSTKGQFGFPVMTEKQVVQEGLPPSCRSARCPRTPSFPPAAAGGKNGKAGGAGGRQNRQFGKPKNPGIDEKKKENTMRKIIVSEYVTLDGVMEDPGGAEGFKHGGWSFGFGGADQQQYKFEELFASDALLLGRRTYEGFAAAWPNMPGTGEYGERMNSLPKYVASTTL